MIKTTLLSSLIVILLVNYSQGQSYWQETVTNSKGKLNFFHGNGGNLHYGIRTAEGGGWSWQFSDGNNVTYFQVDFPTANTGIGIENPDHQLSLPDGGSNISLGKNIFINGQGSNGRISNNAYHGEDNWAIADVTAKASTIEIRDTGIIELYGTTQTGQLDWKMMFGIDAPNNKAYFPNGNVGIGMMEPNAPLSFANEAGNKINLYHTTGGIGDRYGLGIANSELRIYSGAQGEITGGIVFGKHSNDTFDETIRFTNSGSVGIGIADPGNAKLAVAGIIASTEVIVEINPGQGPDYVFADGYELRSLQETKEYISKNKHLPEIPSAEEMEEKGIELADMNMLLLKKIEELTLYQIGLLEEMEALKEKVSRLEARQ